MGPIIGILTEPLGTELSTELGALEAHYNQTYIAASYVKFAESAGARVVPLHFDATDAELQELFHQINGIIFPGGGTNIFATPGNRFREAARLLFNLALEANGRGDHFPVHGTCLGFQLLHVLAAEDDDVMCRGCFATEGTPLPLNFTDEAKSSKLFSAMSAPLFNALSTQNITENSHSSGVTPDTYKKSSKLQSFFKILSTNEDYRGREFVSTVEARQYPFTASQWHPEKNNFEWGKIGRLGSKAIPHSADAVLVSQYMANDFVGRARLSSHRFTSADAEALALIYNRQPVADPQGYFAQVYLWNKSDQRTLPVMV